MSLRAPGCVAVLLLIGAWTDPAGGQEAVASPHGPLPDSLDCSACHTDEGWKPLRTTLAFDHAGTGFGLAGAHADVACASCHTNLRFDAPTAKASDCASCHTDAHEGRMTQPCVTCHTTRSFQQVDGEAIHARTSFPLTGAHRQVTCESCHTSDEGGAFAALPTDCVSCHRADYEGARTVDHVASGYPTTCTQCHSTVGWSDSPSFDHVAASGGFALVGAHSALRCESCHRTPGMEPLFPGATQGDCASCHQADYDRAHAGSGYPTTCASCHGAGQWAAATFDHGSTGFPLVGAHVPVTCADCHGPPTNLSGLTAGPNDCVACHRADYDRQHGGSSFPTTCLSCHDQSEWEGTSLDHASLSGGFALQGPHATAACTSCHSVPDYGLLFPKPAGQTDCASCHQADYDRQHTGSGYPTTCLSCHRPDTWSGAAFDHASTGFPLVGAHVPVTCADCHGPPTNLSGLTAGPNDCVACHRADYDRQHGGSNIPTTCLSCHNQSSFSGAAVDHASLSGGFALEGPHATTACTSCHAIPGYGLLFPKPAGQTDCASCHQADYDREHTGSGYPTTCLSCHRSNSWSGATFDHATTGFPLVGAHAPATCASCHGPPTNLSGLPAGPNDCVACHRADYDRQHGGSNIPTTCLSCHDQSSWGGAVVDHVAISGGFALQGPHATTECTSCHAVPGYALLFPAPAGQNDCVACHQADYDREHAGSGFPTTCLSCHQSNSWSGATLDHAQISGGFQLLGAHANAACTSCHAVPGYALLFPAPAGQNDCVACHQADYNGAHGGSGYPTDCASCHSMNAWQPSTFNHDSQYFPIYSGTHRGRWDSCNDCHQGGNVNDFTCLTCHTRSPTDSHHREVRSYTYESHACLSCHPSGRGG